MQSGIDNSAHIGGLTGGFAFGFLFYFFIVQRKSLVTYSFITLGIAFVITGSYFMLHQADRKLYVHQREDPITFQSIIKQIGIKEQQALNSENNLRSANAQQGLLQVNTIMLPAWQNSKQLIEKANDLVLNEKLVKVRQSLSGYINLRIAQTNLFGQYFKGDSATVQPQLILLKRQIDSVLNSINQTLNQ